MRTILDAAPARLKYQLEIHIHIEILFRAGEVYRVRFSDGVCFSIALKHYLKYIAMRAKCEAEKRWNMNPRSSPRPKQPPSLVKSDDSFLISSSSRVSNNLQKSLQIGTFDTVNFKALSPSSLVFPFQLIFFASPLKRSFFRISILFSSQHTVRSTFSTQSTLDHGTLAP